MERVEPAFALGLIDREHALGWGHIEVADELLRVRRLPCLDDRLRTEVAGELIGRCRRYVSTAHGSRARWEFPGKDAGTNSPGTDVEGDRFTDLTPEPRDRHPTVRVDLNGAADRQHLVLGGAVSDELQPNGVRKPGPALGEVDGARWDVEGQEDCIGPAAADRRKTTDGVATGPVGHRVERPEIRGDDADSQTGEVGETGRTDDHDVACVGVLEDRCTERTRRIRVPSERRNRYSICDRPLPCEH